MNIFNYRLQESVPNDGGAGGGGEEESLRDSLESAFDAAEETAAPAPSPDAGEDRGDGRTSRGTFARKSQESAPAQPQSEPQAQRPVDPNAQQAQPQRDPFAKPPQSWKPGAREAWGSLPPHVREEIHRRERESARAISDYGTVRQLQERVDGLAQKYAPALQAEGVDLYTATENLMNLASRLRFGSPLEKAQLAAQIIRSYGVDISALDAVLVNAPVQQFAQPQMMQDPRVDQLMAQLQQAQQTQQQRLTQAATEEVEQFGSDLEFFEDVRNDMADLMEMFAKRGVDMSLKEAYERACSMSPDISKVMAARAQAAAAGTARQSTQKARHAASSVRGTPSAESTPVANDLRGAIEAAYEQVAGR